MLFTFSIPALRCLLLSDMGGSEELIRTGGLLLLAVLIMLESAVLLGTIMPGGDMLLFTAGLLCGTDVLDVPVELLVLVLVVSGITGDMFGYWLGFSLRRSVYNWKETWYFKPQHLRLASRFYRRHGKLALIIGKYLPVIRSLNPVLAAISGMHFRRYLLLSIVATTLWIFPLVAAGYWLGNRFPWLRQYLMLFVLAIILLALLPLAGSFVRRLPRRRRK